MTVEEMIERLQKYNPKSEVWLWDEASEKMHHVIEDEGSGCHPNFDDEGRFADAFVLWKDELIEAERRA